MGKHYGKETSVIVAFWNYFWKKPIIKCVKCGSENIEYYDPFFFSPIRTLKGKRRFICNNCHFVWRRGRDEST